MVLGGFTELLFPCFIPKHIIILRRHWLKVIFWAGHKCENKLPSLYLKGGSSFHLNWKRLWQINNFSQHSHGSSKVGYFVPEIVSLVSRSFSHSNMVPTGVNDTLTPHCSPSQAGWPQRSWEGWILQGRHSWAWDTVRFTEVWDFILLSSMLIYFIANDSLDSVMDDALSGTEKWTLTN